MVKIAWRYITPHSVRNWVVLVVTPLTGIGIAIFLAAAGRDVSLGWGALIAGMGGFAALTAAAKPEEGQRDPVGTDISRDLGSRRDRMDVERPEGELPGGLRRVRLGRHWPHLAMERRPQQQGA